MVDALHRRLRGDGRSVAAGLARLSLVVVALTVWAAFVGAAYWPVAAALPGWFSGAVPVNLLFNRPVGLVVGALAYLRVRGADVLLMPPEPSRRRSVLGAALVPATLVCVAAFVGTTVFETPLSVMVGSSYGPRVGVEFFLRHEVLPAVLFALGSSALWYGVIQERVRELASPDHTVALTVLLAWLAESLPFADGVTSVRTGPNTALLLGIAVVATVSLWFSVGVVYRSIVRGSCEGLLHLRYAPAFALGSLMLATALAGLFDFPAGGYGILRVVALGAGAYGYERTRSLWTPTATLVAFNVAVETVLVAEAALGVVPT